MPLKKILGFSLIASFIFFIGIPAFVAHFYSLEIANYFLKDILGDLSKAGVQINIHHIGFRSSDVEVNIPKYKINNLLLHPKYQFQSLLPPSLALHLSLPLHKTSTLETAVTLPLLKSPDAFVISGNSRIEPEKKPYPFFIGALEWVFSKEASQVQFTARIPVAAISIDKMAFDEDIVLTAQTKTLAVRPFTVDFTLQSGEALQLKGKVTVPEAPRKSFGEIATLLDFSSYPQLLEFYPSSSEIIKKLNGAIKIKSTFSENFDHAKIHLETVSLSGTAFNLPFQDLVFKTDATLLPRVKSTNDAVFTVKRFGGEVFIENLKLRAKLVSSQDIGIKEFSGSFSGGTITTKPFQYSLKNDQFDMHTSLNGISIEKLLELLKLDSIVADGTLDGNVHLKRTKDKLQIESLAMKNQHPGHLQYREPSAAHIPQKIDYLDEFNALLAQGQQMLVYKALDNFDYSELRLNAERTERGELDFFLHLKGKNPDIAKGQPFEINLPVSGNVESLLEQSLIKSFLENSTWEEKLKEMQELQ